MVRIYLIYLFVCHIINYYINEIFLGDKQNHTVSLHLALPLHLSVFITLLFGPLPFIRWMKKTILSLFQVNFKQLIQTIFIFLLGWIIVAYILHYYTLPHPFLLADNR